MMMMHRPGIYLSMAVMKESPDKIYNSLFELLDENPEQEYGIIYLITDADGKKLQWADDYYSTPESAIAAIETQIIQEILPSLDSLNSEQLSAIMDSIIHKIFANGRENPQKILYDITATAENAARRFSLPGKPCSTEGE